MGFKGNLYEVLFEAISEGLLLVDDRGIIIESNKMSAAMFGYEEGELIGKSIEVLVPDGAKKAHEEYRNKYNNQPKARPMGANIKLDGVKKDKSQFPVQISLTPLKNEEGKNFIITLISDITERRENEENLYKLRESLEQQVRDRTKKLRESEQLYKSIARNFPSGVISIFDSSYKYLFAEGQALYELGIETSDLIGLDYLSRIDERARDQVKEELDKVFQGDSNDFEVTVGGQTYLLNAVPLSEDAKNIDKILVVEKNITAQIEVAKKLEDNLNQERELADMKSRFVSMASHEFRTPLTTINSSASLIRKYLEKGWYEKIDKHVDKIQNSVHNLTSILNDFLSFEKLETDKVNVLMGDCDIAEILMETFDEMSTVMKVNQVIKYNGPNNLLFFTDGQLLKNTMLNLLSNAIKYSKEDGEIIVTLIGDEDDIKISIQDFGLGIPVKDQKNLFSRFFRAENVTNIEGTGLGLIIVRRYLDLLNGEINFKSEEGEGTTFYITLSKI